MEPTHYSVKAIQPIEYIIANNLNFCEGNVVKYVTRYSLKNGIEDLLKAKQYIQYLIDEEERKAAEAKKLEWQRIQQAAEAKGIEDRRILKS